MPYLKTILLNATDKSNRMLRAKSMECISLVGMAVGKEKFGKDAKQVTSEPIHPFVQFLYIICMNHITQGLAVTLCKISHCKLWMLDSIVIYDIYYYLLYHLK